MNVTLTRPTIATLDASRPVPPSSAGDDSSGRASAGSRLDASGPSRLFLADAMARERLAANGAFATVDEVASDTANDDRVSFERRFAALAADPEALRALLAEVYGTDHDAAAAEALRTRALGGDFTWLPSVRYVGSDVLGDAHGAYDAASDTIYIAERLRGTALAGEVFAEETGHALDVRLNGTDTVGDEGELFRRLLAGERLDARAIAAIRAEIDGGTIVVDGERREVEFWNPLKKAWDWAKEKVIEPAGRFLDRNVWQPLREHVIEPVAESWLGRTVISWTMRGLHAFGTWLDGLTGAPEERGLTAEEIAYLRPIYGDSIDYDAIRIQRGGVKDLLNMRSNTVGHDIYMDEHHTDANLHDANGQLTASGRQWLETLGHEAMHVWQYEQRGTNYIGDALVAQWFGDGYDLQKAFDESKAFADMNPEQQGMMAQYIGLAILADSNGALTETGFESVSGISLTPEQFRIVQAAHATLLAG